MAYAYPFGTRITSFNFAASVAFAFILGKALYPDYGTMVTGISPVAAHCPVCQPQPLGLSATLSE